MGQVLARIQSSAGRPGSVEADVHFHLLITHATGNRYFFDILSDLGDTIITRARVNSAQLAHSDPAAYLERVNREHDNIYRAIVRQDAEFQQHIEAVRGDGDCLLSLRLPVAVQILHVGKEQYMLSDGAFVAASETVDLKVRTQSLGYALFAQSGGFLGNLINSQTSGEGMVLRFSGSGKVLICARNSTAFKTWVQTPAQ